MIPDEFQKQVAEGGLWFEAYLPSELALWVVALVEQGGFTSPAEAVLVVMQTFQDYQNLNCASTAALSYNVRKSLA